MESNPGYLLKSFLFYTDPRSPTDAQNMRAYVQHVLHISKPTFQLFLLASVFAVLRPTLIFPYFMQGCTMGTNNL